MSGRGAIEPVPVPPRADPPAASARVLRALAPFGLTPEACAAAVGEGSEVDPVARRLAKSPAGAVVLLAGPSGGGKSTLLRAVADRLDRAGARLVRLDPCSSAADGRAVVDALPGPPERAWRALSLAGLAEAALLARPVRALSDGQRWRLALASAVREAERTRACDRARGVWLVIDECAQALDRLTASSVLGTLSRWARGEGARLGVRVLAAGAHEDLPGLLGPDELVRCEPMRAPRLLGPCRAERPGLRISDGTVADYDALACFHYRAGRPATRVLVRVAALDTPAGPVRAGVLVVSMPTLNGAWREAAWPGRYTRGCKRARAARLNAELRCLSRVVVDPRCRGLGVARALVADYLACPRTPATEAVAAMGRVCPFFERAGMRAVTPAPPPADARLGDALAHAGVRPWALLDAHAAEAAASDALLARELRTWQRSSPRLRLAGAPLAALARAAGRRLGSPPVAYSAGVPGGETGDGG